MRPVRLQRIAGYEDVNDAERLSQDPTFRLIGSEKIWDRGAALTSRLQTFETEMLAEEENFASLARINRELIGKAEALDSPQRVVLDMDSTEIPVYGQQEQQRLQRPLRVHLLSPAAAIQSGRRLPGGQAAARQRPQCRTTGRNCSCRRSSGSRSWARKWSFRADAAFAKPEIYEALEERGVKYAIRIPANENLERDIAELLTAAWWEGRATSPWSGTRAFCTRQPVGRRRGAWWRRWSIIGRTVPARGLHRDQPGDGQPGGGAVL